MKMKDLIEQLKQLDPEQETNIEKIDIYKASISKNLKITVTPVEDTKYSPEMKFNDFYKAFINERLTNGQIYDYIQTYSNKKDYRFFIDLYKYLEIWVDDENGENIQKAFLYCALTQRYYEAKEYFTEH